MGKSARASLRVRQDRRERLARKFPVAGRILEDPTGARIYIAMAPFARVLIEQGVHPTPGLGVENFDAVVSLIKDGLGLAALSDAAFEAAIRLATPPECRETLQ